MKRSPLGVATVLCVLAVLSACHGHTTGGKPANPSPGRPAAPSTSPAAPSGALQAGSVRNFARNMAPAAWDPASHRLIFNRRGPDGLWDGYTSAPDGSDERCLTCRLDVPGPGTRSQRGAFAVSPDGKDILLTVEGRHGGQPYGVANAEPGKGSYNDVWLIRADGSKAWRLSDIAMDGAKGTMWPAFDRSGHRIVWAQMTGGVSLRALLGSWQIKVARLVWERGTPHLADVRTYEPEKHKFYEPYEFTPDDSGVLMSSDYSMRSALNAQIWIMDVGTGKMRRISPSDAPQGPFTNYNEFARFTPDGRHIIYGRTKGDRSGMDYWSARPDGSDARRLTFMGEKWNIQSRGYGNVGGFAFDPADPRQIFAGRSTDLTARHIDALMIDLTTGGLHGSYYRDRDFQGAAASVVENPTAGLSFASQATAGLPGGSFSARWTGKLDAPEPGDYAFTARLDGSSKLWVEIDGIRLGGGTHASQDGSYHGTVKLSAGKHRITVNYVSGSGDGFEQLLWTTPGASAAAPIPVSRLSPS